jgi:hypothetical protein
MKHNLFVMDNDLPAGIWLIDFIAYLKLRKILEMSLLIYHRTSPPPLPEPHSYSGF